MSRLEFLSILSVGALEQWSNKMSEVLPFQFWHVRIYHSVAIFFADPRIRGSCLIPTPFRMSRLELGLDFHSMGRNSGAVEQQEEWSLAFTSSSLGNFAALTLVQTCEELPLKQTIQHSFPWLPFLTFKEVDSRIWCHISISDIILGSKVSKDIEFLD